MTSTVPPTTGTATSPSAPARAIPKLAAALAGGALFGFGLALSTMIRPDVVLSFLRFKDMGLLFVLGAGAGVTLIGYRLAPRLMSRPLLGGTFGVHEAHMDRSTVIGAAIFGIGWGLCGVCPGPSIAGLGAGSFELGFAIAGMAVGALVHGVTTRPGG